MVVLGATSADTGALTVEVRATTFQPEGITLGKLLLQFDLGDEAPRPSTGAPSPPAPDVRLEREVADALFKVIKDG